jgi:hypothetical protein
MLKSVMFIIFTQATKFLKYLMMSATKYFITNTVKNPQLK